MTCLGVELHATRNGACLRQVLQNVLPDRILRIHCSVKAKAALPRDCDPQTILRFFVAKVSFVEGQFS